MVFTNLLSLTMLLNLQATSGPQPGQTIPSSVVTQINSLASYESKTSCDYYLQFQSIFSYCSSTDYIIGFGDYYCNQFSSYLSDFEDQTWVNDVRYCL